MDAPTETKQNDRTQCNGSKLTIQPSYLGLVIIDVTRAVHAMSHLIACSVVKLQAFHVPHVLHASPGVDLQGVLNATLYVGPLGGLLVLRMLGMMLMDFLDHVLSLHVCHRGSWLLHRHVLTVLWFRWGSVAATGCATK